MNGNQATVGIALAIVMIFYIAGWMLRSWLSHREKMKGLSMTKAGLGSSDERLARVEQAVESIAIEVERISEGQRFVTKLMSDRSQPMLEGVAIPAQPRRVDTPH
jgi:hypothetical protein